MLQARLCRFHPPPPLNRTSGNSSAPPLPPPPLPHGPLCRHVCVISYTPHTRTSRTSSAPPFAPPSPLLLSAARNVAHALSATAPRRALKRDPQSYLLRPKQPPRPLHPRPLHPRPPHPRLWTTCVVAAAFEAAHPPTQNLAELAAPHLPLPLPPLSLFGCSMETRYTLSRQRSHAVRCSGGRGASAAAQAAHPFFCTRCCCCFGCGHAEAEAPWAIGSDELHKLLA
jgi:hypothetical protein